MQRSFLERSGALGRATPKREVAPPRLVSIGAIACAAVLAACTSSSADQVTGPVDLGMTSSMQPFFNDGQTMLFQVQVPVPLPVRKMTGQDVRSVGATPAGTPYPRGVFLNANDELVELHYTISNLDTSDHAVWLLFDPWNEFVRWDPGVTVTEEETIPNFGYDQIFTIPAMQRLEGTMTTDDMKEMSNKLASVENFLANTPPQPADGSGVDTTGICNNIFNPQNRSNSNDPLYTPWIPPVIAGLTGFDLGLRTGEPANVAVEVTMEVQDLHGGRFVDGSQTNQQMGPPPDVLSPPGARF